MEEFVELDGQKISKEELTSLIEASKKEGKLIKEVSPGVFKTLQKLED